MSKIIMKLELSYPYFDISGFVLISLQISLIECPRTLSESTSCGTVCISATRRKTGRIDKAFTIPLAGKHAWVKTS